jgi:hypothetical protein
LGIGTTNPTFNLSVAGTLGISEAGATGARLKISTSSAGAVFDQNDNSNIYFKQIGVTKLTIDYPSGDIVANKFYGQGSVQGGTAVMTAMGGYAVIGSNNSTTPVMIARDANTAYPDIVIDSNGDVTVANRFKAGGRQVQDSTALGGINTYKHVSRKVTGVGDETVNIMRYCRYWWGVGHFLITIRATYYGGDSLYGQFLIDGHTRSGLPVIRTIYNNGINTPIPANYNAAEEWCEITFKLSSYRHYVINFETQHSTHESDVNNVGSNGGFNNFHIYGGTEVI